MLSLAHTLHQTMPFGPSLDLRFDSQLDPRITFTRASSATRVNALGVVESVAANAPRFDYDPVTLAARGFLLEEQRTNLLLRSAEFDNSVWAKSGATVSANVSTAPDGTMTADKLVESAANSDHLARQGAGTSAVGSTFTLSVYLKAAERSAAYIRLGQANSPFNYAQAYVNLSNGTITTALQFLGSNISSPVARISNAGGGWYRADLSATFNVADTVSSGVFSGTNTSSVSYTGDGTSGIFIWGAQLEVGAFPTSYIPTTTAQVTRAADSAVISGANFSQFYNQSEGTLYADWSSMIPGGASGYLPYSVGLTDNPATSSSAQLVIQSRAQNNQIRVWQSTTGGDLDDFSTPGIGVHQGKAAVAYGAGLMVSASANGGSVVTIANQIQTTQFSALTIGVNASSSPARLNGHIRSIRYYPRRMSNAELQALTA